MQRAPGRPVKGAGKPNEGIEDFCCGIKLWHEPTPLQCHGAESCFIRKNDNYHFVKDMGFCYCERCFKTIEEEIVIDDKVILKSSLVKLRNNVRTDEAVVTCGNCGSKFHKICVLFREEITKMFVCPKCLHAKVGNLDYSRYIIPDGPYRAKNLPETILSRHIEDKLAAFMSSKAMVPAPGKVHIRVLSSTKKETEVLNNLQESMAEERDESVSSYPHQDKMVFAFQEIQGCDVAFFAFVVQEYGDDCPEPNRGRIYLAYVDSVQFFRPRMLRTQVYYEILLAYLEYAKGLGFSTAHIWVCPPQEQGLDYIFYCHPPSQAMPGRDRLVDWYDELLQQGKERGIVIKNERLMDYMINAKQTSVSGLPYFYGDHWPKYIEECFEIEENLQSQPPKKKRKCSRTELEEQSRKRAVREYERKIKVESGTLDPIMQRVLHEMKFYQKYFLVSTLNANNDGLKRSLDQDPQILSKKSMDTRDAFVQLAQSKMYEFSSLRRAKYSTLNLLHDLNPEVVRDQKEGPAPVAIPRMLRDSSPEVVQERKEGPAPVSMPRMWHDLNPVVLKNRKEGPAPVAIRRKLGYSVTIVVDFCHHT